ncbi:unnamed protein product [Larinioides sclopetarius]|uniref:Uncharacterized protein n=1 Tax=Larinioides sclopetarius TaxID=280406 RepID=A0AAV2BP86_9ARAC
MERAFAPLRYPTCCRNDCFRNRRQRSVDRVRKGTNQMS